MLLTKFRSNPTMVEISADEYFHIRATANRAQAHKIASQWIENYCTSTYHFADKSMIVIDVDSIRIMDRWGMTIGKFQLQSAICES